MQLEYRVEADDYLAFNLHVMRTSPVFRAQAMRQRVVAAVTSTVIAMAVVGVVTGEWAGGAITGIVAGAGAWWTLPRVHHRHVERTLRRLAAGDGLGPSGDVRLTIDDVGLHETLAGTSTTIGWAGVTRVDETDHHAFVFSGLHAAIVVPRRAGRVPELLDSISSHVRDEGAPAAH
ncbi:YcxB family protein [Isoptericola sp. NPDC019482]|uniref:YcxB family protein n=1 Tax=Isoptericola sp. NPDC019482 TaxID=3154688 RepID=UPI00349601DA